MDSLVTSAIGLAAGGWDKVKLVGIYNGPASSIPAWKLGILSYHSSVGYVTQNGMSLMYPNTIIAPGGTCTGVLFIPNNTTFPTFQISFEPNSITTPSNLNFTSILFTW